MPENNTIQREQVSAAVGSTVDAFIGEVRILPYNFVPEFWARCEGQLISIQENPALYALIGTNFGGDGRTNFALPDLRGRGPAGAGTGPGLSPYHLGDRRGQDYIVLNQAQLPVHSHSFRASGARASTSTPGENQVLARTRGTFAYSNDTSQPQTMSSQALAIAGNSGAHSNMQPYLALAYCIALDGIFPQRS